MAINSFEGRFSSGLERAGKKVAGNVVKGLILVTFSGPKARGGGRKIRDGEGRGLRGSGGKTGGGKKGAGARRPVRSGVPWGTPAFSGKAFRGKRDGRGTPNSSGEGKVFVTTRAGGKVGSFWRVWGRQVRTAGAKGAGGASGWA